MSCLPLFPTRQFNQQSQKLQKLWIGLLRLLYLLFYYIIAYSMVGCPSFTLGRILVMTYDYQSYSLPSHIPVVNAPLTWVQTVLTAFGNSDPTILAKILMGIPLYGWKGSEALTGESFSIVFHHMILSRYTLYLSSLISTAVI